MVEVRCTGILQLSCSPRESGQPSKFSVAGDFDGDRVVSIHDFLYARYAMDGVDLSPLNSKALLQ
jgi:hypothetical protein